MEGTIDPRASIGIQVAEKILIKFIKSAISHFYYFHHDTIFANSIDLIITADEVS